MWICISPYVFVHVNSCILRCSAISIISHLPLAVALGSQLAVWVFDISLKHTYIYRYWHKTLQACYVPKDFSKVLTWFDFPPRRAVTWHLVTTSLSSPVKRLHFVLMGICHLKQRWIKWKGTVEAQRSVQPCVKAEEYNVILMMIIDSLVLHKLCRKGKIPWLSVLAVQNKVVWRRGYALTFILKLLQYWLLVA